MSTTSRPLPACCVEHDGPHLHRCARPRTTSGREHSGACLLATSQSEAVTRPHTSNLLR